MSFRQSANCVSVHDLNMVMLYELPVPLLLQSHSNTGVDRGICCVFSQNIDCCTRYSIRRFKCVVTICLKLLAIHSRKFEILKL